MSNTYIIIEELAKALREKQDELDIAESENSDRANELFNTCVEIDQLNKDLAEALLECDELRDQNKQLDIHNLKWADIDRTNRKVIAGYINRFHCDGEEIHKLNVEINELRSINESLRQGLIASQANVARLNEMLDR